MTAIFRISLTWLLASISLTALCAGASMHQGYVDAYGGEYSVACKDPSALRAKISKEGLSLSRGSRTVNAGFEMDALNYFGRATPPDDFTSALMGKGVIFVIYKTKAGLVLDVEGDPAVLKEVGAMKGATKLRKC